MTLSTWRVRGLLEALLISGALATAGCGGGPYACPAVVAPALEVTVVDAMSGTHLCDAAVVARDGSFSQVLEANYCLYSGPPERAGTYAVDASLGTRTTTVSNVKVGQNDCGVVTQRLTIALNP